MPDPPKPSRRDFLRGRAALDAITKRVDDTAQSTDSSEKQSPRGANSRQQEATATDPTQQPYLASYGRQAMACEFQLYLNAGQYELEAEHAIAALDLLEPLEAQMTVYREESEINEINRLAAEVPVTVETQLFGLLSQSLELAEQTGGAFDITAGPLSELWSLARREGRLPEQSEIDEILTCVGSHYIDLDTEDETITFTREGVSLNLGGIGKGFALDRCADHLVADGTGQFLFHGGQSSVVARGAPAGHTSGGWTVGLVHPLRPERRVAEITLQGAALSTSGTGTQAFHHQGKRYGHILDPRTGWPAQGVLSCTVVTPSSAVADALSTALFALGPDAAIEFCDRRPEVSMAMIVAGPNAGTIDVITVNMTDDIWHPLRLNETKGRR